MAKLVLRNVTKTFGKTVALNDVSLTVKDGEFFVLLGASGAGKSTTINVIAGLEIPEKGQVFIDEGDVTHAFPQDRNIAAAFESYALYPHFTVFQNLMFPLEAPRRKRTYSKESRIERVKEVAELLSIRELLQRYPRELSGGQKQRVAIARALLINPRILILDDSTSSVDTRTERLIQQALERVMEGRTTFIIAQRLSSVQKADQILVLHDGQIVERGKHDELLALNGHYAEIYRLQLADQERVRLELADFSKLRVPVQVDKRSTEEYRRAIADEISGD